MADISKAQELGFKPKHTVADIVKDQLNYFLKKENRDNYA
jgi:nucleoside-diphosphate-sugar epimerase